MLKFGIKYRPAGARPAGEMSRYLFAGFRLSRSSFSTKIRQKKIYAYCFGKYSEKRSQTVILRHKEGKQMTWRPSTRTCHRLTFPLDSLISVNTERRMEVKTIEGNYTAIQTPVLKEERKRLSWASPNPTVTDLLFISWPSNEKKCLFFLSNGLIHGIIRL